MNTILLGYDGSDGAERALERAADLAQALHASLVVVSVDPPGRLVHAVPALDPAYAALPSPGGSGAPIPLPFSEEQGPAPLEVARHQLERARTRLAPRPIEVDYVSEVGDPAGRLLAVARERDADVVVVGSREHGFVDRLLGRHVDEEVADHAPCDVLLVH